MCGTINILLIGSDVGRKNIGTISSNSKNKISWGPSDTFDDRK